MFDPTKLPKRTQDFHAGKAPEGTRNREAFEAACQCRDNGATEVEAREYVETGAVRCGLSLREAREAVRSAFKKPPREPITKRHGDKGDKPCNRSIAATYDYTDATGKLLFQTLRYTPKDFRQRQPDGKGGWKWNLQHVRLVPYRLPGILKAGEVFVVEGEKDADTLAGLGFTATTAPLGAGKWKLDYNPHFVGKRVVIIPDADEPGQEHAEQVARALHGVAESIRVLRLPGEFNGAKVKDASDYVATFSDRTKAAERLAVLADGAATWTPKPEADAKPSGLQIVSAADLLATVFPDADDLVDGILPKMARLILSAPAKLGKTLFALALSLAMVAGKSVLGFRVRRPLRVLYLQAEVSPRAMQDRLRKMLAGFDVDETALRERLFFYNAPGLKLTDPVHVEAIRKAVALHTPDVLAIDPLYKFHAGDESSVKDMTAFFDPLDILIAECRLSVLLVHHHGKGSGDGLATPAHRNRGSSTIADWPDSLLTLTFEDPGARIVKLAFTLRNAEEPEPVALQLNRDTLLYVPLPEYQFDGRARAAKITDADVAHTIGAKRQVAYGVLAEQLREKFDASERTAKNAIRHAAEAGTIRKDRETGLYEKV